jgi:hypothetical protein
MWFSVLLLDVDQKLSIALQSIVGPWSLFQFLDFYAIGRTPWTGDKHVASPLPTHRISQRMDAHRYPWLEWDSNPLSQCVSGRR